MTNYKRLHKLYIIGTVLTGDSSVFVTGDKLMKIKKPLELYIHIPFCKKKCLYCDFLSFIENGEQKANYVEKLVQEIEMMGKTCCDYEAVSVFLGGGTPSILLAEQTVRTIEAVKRSFSVTENAEVTTEANPGTLDAAKLEAYLACGINRLSLGLQSADDRELKGLGRIHTFQDFLQSFRLARAAGFTNINIDLMSALPGQSLASYQKTLARVTELEPEHISAYSLIVEENTSFYQIYGDSAGENVGNTLPLPDEDTEREMYHFTKRYLKEQGYERYEISNYAKAGKGCRHNIGYWTGVPYLGLGLGASSYLNGERFSNEKDPASYLRYSPRDFGEGRHHRERECLTVREQMEEFMFLGLRLTDGISSEDFERHFGTPLTSVYGEVLETFLEQNLMERIVTEQENKIGIRFRLTDYGTDVSNRVLSGFLL